MPKLSPTEPRANSPARREGDIPSRRSNMGKAVGGSVWQELRTRRGLAEREAEEERGPGRSPSLRSTAEGELSPSRATYLSTGRLSAE